MEFGRPSKTAGDAMYRYICEAVSLCLTGKVQAIATAPICKEALNDAGYQYPGHTELLAELTGTGDFVMMLAGERLRVALVTIHEAIADVPRLITREKILSTVRIVHRGLDRYFAKNPRLAVLALNPHCGEGGLFGTEEKDIIAPAVDAA
jgi:4-hydroxythreonine-4-phosphate dehydrogenase